MMALFVSVKGYPMVLIRTCYLIGSQYLSTLNVAYVRLLLEY